jgi:hypothetical protein
MPFNQSLRKRCAKTCLDTIIHQAITQVARRPGVQQAFLRLLHTIWTRTDLLHPKPIAGRLSWTDAACYVQASFALAHWHQAWLGEAETWEPAGSNHLRQFGSLARHLLAKAPVPNFMDEAWFCGRSREGRQKQKWFRHLGLGYGINGTDIPLRMTKKMVRHFGQAPNSYTIEQAFRWAQILDFGGDKAVVNAVIATRLGREFNHELYWERVIKFVVRNADLVLPYVGAIVEYLHFHKFIFRLEPLLPEKRKTVMTLIEKVVGWRAPSTTCSLAPKLRWHNAGIGNFECHEEERHFGMRAWTIRELLDSNELTAEGKVMRHCVGTYGNRCFKRVSSIWSMMCHSRLGQQHVLTIEIDPSTRTIVQAKGKGNMPPSPDARKIMQKWAAEKYLTVGEGV